MAEVLGHASAQSHCVASSPNPEATNKPWLATTQARDGTLATRGAELETERLGRCQAGAAVEALQLKLAQQSDALGKQARRDPIP